MRSCATFYAGPRSFEMDHQCREIGALVPSIRNKAIDGIFFRKTGLSFEASRFPLDPLRGLDDVVVFRRAHGPAKGRVTQEAYDASYSSVRYNENGCNHSRRD